MRSCASLMRLNWCSTMEITLFLFVKEGTDALLDGLVTAWGSSRLFGCECEEKNLPILIACSFVERAVSAKHTG